MLTSHALSTQQLLAEEMDRAVSNMPVRFGPVRLLGALDLTYQGDQHKGRPLAMQGQRDLHQTKAIQGLADLRSPTTIIHTVAVRRLDSGDRGTKLRLVGRDDADVFPFNTKDLSRSNSENRVVLDG